MRNNIKSLVLLFYKTIVYFAMYTIFFQMFQLRNIGLRYVSRTTVITTMTFVIVLVLMIMVYGNFNIGKQKSKPIIYSTMIAVVLTDFLTYMQLMVMNTNPNNNVTFKIEQLDILLYVIVMQLVVVYFMAYLGNSLYFKMYTSEKVLLVRSLDSDEVSFKKVHNYLSAYKLQYDIVSVIDFTSVNNFDFDNIDTVIYVGSSKIERSTLVDFCYDNKINISFTPTITDIIELTGAQVVYDDVPMIMVDSVSLSFEQRILKRVLDLVISLLGLIISSPIWIVAAFAIKLNDGGKIFFKQQRYTIDGKVFNVIKFRTMKENVENYSSTVDDDRITSVGKILRKIRMDELPQILNILMGDMSLVGPRPEMLENVHQYEEDLPEFRYRLNVKAGLTGIAQIEGKYNTTPKDKLLMDLMYIENYSVWLDIKLILRTITVVFNKESTQGFEDGEE